MDPRRAGRYVLSMSRQRYRTALLALLACTMATGCGLLPGSHTETCVDWIRFESPQELFDDAALVVVGTPTRTDGATSLYGYTAQIHIVEVEKVLKGQPGPEPLRIASTPETCTGGISYPHGDPLDREQRLLIYASHQQGGWFTLTPAQGAVPFGGDAALPFRAR
jgi:hypothetical protein